MTTLDELINYCNADKVIGALLLTGEWGCGKTHLIEHELKDALSGSHVFVRVSLFGIDSIESLNTTVKKEWASNCSSFFGKIENHETATKIGKTLFGTVASAIPVIKDMKDAVLSVNPLDYITIKPQIEDNGTEKRVLLIFDDLERANPSIGVNAILGCINDYCENLHFHVIVIANEERINIGQKDTHEDYYHQKNNISYNEIKEKIISKTIRIVPNYDAIITSLVDEEEWIDEDYTKFLQDNKAIIQMLFSSIEEENCDDQIADKPHNIRSLKSALQDFFRIFSIFKDITSKDSHNQLNESELRALKLMFMQMIAFTMETKAGRDIYSDLFLVSEEELSTQDSNGEYDDPFEYMKRYPDDVFNSQIASKAFIRWIKNGLFNETQIESDIQKLIKRLTPNRISDSETFLTTKLLHLEWSSFENGYREALKAAYNGELTSEQYIGLLSRIYQIKKHQITIPEEPNYAKMNVAYDAIDVLAETEPDFGYDDSRVVDDEAKELYEKIKKRIASRTVEKKRKEYYDYCLTYFRNINDTITQHFTGSNSIQITLDDILIDAIISSYKISSNRIRQSIENAFNNISFTDYRTSQTAPILIQKLEELRESSELDPIGKVNIREFIDTVKTKFAISENGNDV